MLAFLSRFSSTAIMWAVIAVVGVLATAVGTQTLRLAWAEADLAEMTTQRDTARSNYTTAAAAASSNADASERLSTDLRLCVGDKQRIAAAESAARSDLETASRDRARLTATLKREREKAYAQDPACIAWNGAALCPAASDGMRRIWQSAHRAGGDAGRPSGQAVRGDPGRSDQGSAVAGAPDAGYLGLGVLQADCYSNAQLYDAYETAVNAWSGLADQLAAVRRLSDEAVAAPGTGPGNAKQ